jgi:hypothetical protein
LTIHGDRAHKANGLDEQGNRAVKPLRKRRRSRKESWANQAERLTKHPERKSEAGEKAVGVLMAPADGRFVSNWVVFLRFAIRRSRTQSHEFSKPSRFIHLGDFDPCRFAKTQEIRK